MSDFREHLQQEREQELGEIIHRTEIPIGPYSNLLLSVKDDYLVDINGNPRIDWSAASHHKSGRIEYEVGQRVKMEHYPNGVYGMVHVYGTIAAKVTDRLYMVHREYDDRIVGYYHHEIKAAP